MKLEKLVLENFRQFKGRQELIFSDLDDRNITLVHAENGFGKTTLLKALLWALYGRDGIHDDFEHPDRILHEGLAYQADDKNEVAAQVMLTFSHDMKRYVLTRRLTLAQQEMDPKKTELNLQVMSDGQSFSVAGPQKWIQNMVPDGISAFLFFNGERINYLAEERNRSKITEAIHTMLGLQLLKTTIDDLKHQSVLGKLRGEQREATTDEKRDLLNQLLQQEEEQKHVLEQKEQIHSNLSALASEIELVDRKLAANREVYELQNERMRLLEDCEHKKKQLNDLISRLSRLIAEDGYTLLTTNLIKRGKEITLRLRSEGRIPARVLNSYLQELLDQQQCLCQRPLLEGSSEWMSVEQLFQRAGDQDFNNAVGALDHAIGLIAGVEKQTREQLQNLNRERLELKVEIEGIEERIEEIHQKIGGKKDDTVQQLEDSRKKLLLRRDEEHADSGRIEQKIEIQQQQIESLKNQIRLQEDQEESAARAQRRVDAVEDIIQQLIRILEAETRDLHPLLNDEISRHFRMIIDRDYWAELTEDYVLRIRKQVATAGQQTNPEIIDAALSTGQRTVISLVFIASLVALAQKRSEIPTILKGLSGSAYPVAIDSPFGSLSIFREGVARYIPELAPQVLLLVSPEQYNGQVENVFQESGRVGKRYYLSYHGPSIPERAQPELELHGEKIQQYFPSDEAEYTLIREIEI